jgi:hypothetical protein
MQADDLDKESWFSMIQLQPGENLIGIYRNSLEDLKDSIAVTDLGIHIYRSSCWEYVGYTQMESIAIPEEKQEADFLLVSLTNGRATNVPIRGGQGRFRDAFEFLRFLDRVIQDIQKEKEVN